MNRTQDQKPDGQVVLKLDHIDDEIMWPEFDGDEMRVGWVDAFVGTKALLLNVKWIRRIYAFGGKLYVVYDAGMRAGTSGSPRRCPNWRWS